MQDWSGNKQSIFTTLGASNHVDHERAEYDYYATEPKAMELLLQEERFSPVIWEPACGEGHLSKVLEKHGYEVINTDLVYRRFGAEQSVDFLKLNRSTDYFEGDIITNPPYKYAYDRGFDWGGLYEHFRRVSCWCCPLQRLSELRTLRKNYPELWQELLYMDSRVEYKFKPDYSVEQLERRFALEDAQQNLF